MGKRLELPVSFLFEQTIRCYKPARGTTRQTGDSSYSFSDYKMLSSGMNNNQNRRVAHIRQIVSDMAIIRWLPTLLYFPAKI
jgi:hypothetical protein